MQNVFEYFLLPASPIFSLILVALFQIALECVKPDSPSRLKSVVPFLGPLAAIACTGYLNLNWPIDFATTGYVGEPIWLAEFGRHFRLDFLSLGFFWAINVFLFFSFLFLNASWGDERNKSEVFILMQFIATGMMLLVSADSLLMVFTALELLSLPTYILVGLRRKDPACSEAALKYFLFGSFATVILLFGIALLYAQFGTLHLPTITDLAQLKVQDGTTPNLFFLASSALFLIGVGFKVGIAPFHMWVPDTYEGAPSSITGFMGSAVKLTGFALVIRLFWGIFLPLAPTWAPIMATLAVITMFVGNIAALSQENLKRLFAYSSISHAGYLLLGITAVSANGETNYQPLYFYLVTYGFMFLGFFGVLSLLEKEAKSTDISTLAGMGFSHPFLGLCLSVFALSAAGIPPTAGFLGKYFVFLEAVKAGRTPFVILAVISSAIGLYYYLRILVYLYMKESDSRASVYQINRIAMIGIIACAITTLYFGLLPSKMGM